MHLKLSVSLFLIAAMAQQVPCQPASAAPAGRKPAAAGKRAPGAKQAPAGNTAPAKTVDLSGPYNAYLGRLRGKVMPNWDYPPGKFHVVLQAVVNADGSVGQVTVSSTPKGDAAERAASSAFSQAQPLEPLPEKSTPTVRITMNFDSSYDPHGDSNSNFSARLDPIQPPKLQPAAPSTSSESSPATPAAGSESSPATPAAGGESPAAPAAGGGESGGGGGGSAGGQEP